MKIKSLRIENFRNYKDETIILDHYTCFVGPNGAGKSSALAALNVFFCEKDSSTTDTSNLTEEDYFSKNTTTPIRITVTFNALNQAAQEELAAYVRQNELVVTATAVFDTETCVGKVKYSGQRLGMQEFRNYFSQEKEGANATQLKTLFNELRSQFSEILPANSKEERAKALRDYEAAHPDLCLLIPSEDTFYGINGTGKLAPYVQWVYVPAVKDASEEGQESKNTALSKLVTRAVNNRSDFHAQIEALKQDMLREYEKLLEINRSSLGELCQSLQNRMESWAHPNVRLGMDWIFDPNKSVVIQHPMAGIKTGDGNFLGSLERMGHGLQRSYLLALLQELANSDAPDSPTLILGCEEPELYQHPPQARYLADVFCELANENNQIIVTTHSPLFVKGDSFESIRLVTRSEADSSTSVRGLTHQNLCDRIRVARGEDPRRPIEGLVAKIHQSLQPGIAEIFFSSIPIIVEGLEDVAYITTQLHLSGKWREFRRLGCHLIPVNGKDKIIQPLAITLELKMPAFVLFDGDDDTVKAEHRVRQEKDNKTLIKLLDENYPPFPSTNIWARNHVIWQTNITKNVKSDFGNEYDRITNAARLNYAQEGDLEKNELFIAEWVSAAHGEGLSSSSLERLCQSIIDFARGVI